MADQAGLTADALGAALRADHAFEAQSVVTHAGQGFEWEGDLEALALLSGVSGDESRVRSEIQKRLPERLRGAAEVDERGNLIVRVGSNAPPRALFVAHMDEVGFAVTRGSSDGDLSLAARGGVSEDLFAFMPLVFQPAGGPVPGLMARFGSGGAATELADGRIRDRAQGLRAAARIADQRAIAR